jgi:phage tail-like protein
MPIVTPRNTARFQLEVDGTTVGSLRHFSGLGAVADVVQNDAGAGTPPKKHVANFKWTAGHAKLGLGMGQGMYGWLKASLDQGGARKNGSFKVADAAGKVQSAYSFSNALVTAVTFPKLDATSKEVGTLDVAFEAEQLRWALGSGEALAPAAVLRAKAWLSSNFKLSLGTLPCARVVSVEAFTWRCEVASDGIGVGREPTQQPAKVTVPDITLTISAADFAPWAAAAQAWFVEGKRMEADELQGSITLLDPTLTDANALGTITLGNVGFKAFTPPEADANAGHLATFTVVLYVERMGLELKAV